MRLWVALVVAGTCAACGDDCEEEWKEADRLQAEILAAAEIDGIVAPCAAPPTQQYADACDEYLEAKARAEECEESGSD